MAASNWHELATSAVAADLHTTLDAGLSASEANARLAADGPNALVAQASKSPWAILAEQLTATMVVILIVAAALSLFVGDVEDAVVILVVVVLNAALGFTQEYRAERAIEALKRLAVPRVRVRRDGHVQEVAAETLVAGDLMLLDAGNVVGADARVIESASLQVQESTLTGESEPVHKQTAPIHGASVALGDRRNMVYMGTVVTYGRGAAVVTATGMRTELGRIATLLQAVKAEPTPLQQRLDHLGRSVAVAALAIVAVIAGAGLVRGEDLKTMFLTAVSLAVAAVPEGLPAVITIALALGAQRMLRRHALVRKLSAVETLGSVTVICSDKTGTLTENTMKLGTLDLPDGPVDLGPAAVPSLAAWVEHGAGPAPREAAALPILLASFALCSDVTTDGAALAGDPTEVALVAGAATFGIDKRALAREFPRVGEAPFDAGRKRMSTVHAIASPDHMLARALRAAAMAGERSGERPLVAFTKGAVDRLLEVSASVWTAAGVVPLDAGWSGRIQAANDRIAAGGMRVLGAAFRVLPASAAEDGPEDVERDLVFLGLGGIVDPPRPEARAAVADCRSAGVRPVMITGDHPLTAAHVARAVGIDAGGRIVTGVELERMTDEALRDEIVESTNVYARVAPEHKLRIVAALQARRHIVAMTGDGVNDAPALKKANIGVAMGIAGTDVSKEASDMVLLDDNFATIVAAVAEGRVIYDNVRKFVKYLFSTNSAELLVMLVAPFIGMPLPLLPLQILWINLVTDGPTALTLAVEGAEPDVMSRPPSRTDESLFSRDLVRHIVGIALLMSAVSLGAGYWYWAGGHPEWQTVVFTVLAFSQMGHVVAIRSNTIPFWRRGPSPNRALLATVAVTVALQFAVTYVPAAQSVFRTVALPPGDVVVALLLAAVVPVAVEIEKWRVRRSR